MPIFQLPQLGGSVDLDIRIGPYAEAAAGREIGGAVKDAVTKRRLGQRAETDHRARGSQRRYLRRSRVGGVDHAPALIERGILEQPFHRASAERRDAVLHFPQLLGGVDMNRPLRRRLANRPERRGGHRTQGVRRDAHTSLRQSCHRCPRTPDQIEEALGIVDEAALAGSRRRAAEAAIGVERRQQREADAGLRAGRGDTLRHFAGIGVGPAVNVVVQIMELADGREAGLQHFHIGEGGDRLDVVGRKALKEAVHHLAPGPEAVGGRTAALGEPGHAALKGVAMQVRQAGHGNAGNAISPAMQRAFRNRGDGTVGDRDADVARPSGRQQSVVEKEFASQIRSPPRRPGRWNIARPYAPWRHYV